MTVFVISSRDAFSSTVVAVAFSVAAVMEFIAGRPGFFYQQYEALPEPEVLPVVPATPAVEETETHTDSHQP